MKFIGDEGANSLAEALRVNTSFALRVNNYLFSLDLSSNSISAEVVNSLAQALEVNTPLAWC